MFMGGRSGIGSPGLRGLPEAHSGPAFATLVGLAQFAASNELDLRKAVSPTQAPPKPAGGNIFQRMIGALRSGF